MSRRSAGLRPTFFRTDARKKGRLAKKSNRFNRRLNHETLEKRELLAADLLAVRPDSGALITEDTVLNTPPREFSLLFNGDANLEESSIDGNVRLVRSGGDGAFGDGNEVEVSIGYVGFVDPDDMGIDNRHRIMLRPSSTASHNPTDPSVSFPDDWYQIQVIGSDADPLQSVENGNTRVAFGGGTDSITSFRLDRGIQVVSVIPQPVERAASGALIPHDNRIDVYFDDQEMLESVAENPNFYRLVDTSDSNPTTNTSNPDTVDYFPEENRVQLNFLTPIPVATYRLDIGSSLPQTSSAPVTDVPFTPGAEIGTWFGDLAASSAAGNFGNVGSGAPVRHGSEISSAGSVALPARPGGTDEPGHREVQIENHYMAGGAGLGPVAPRDITVRPYAFPQNFPTNGFGQTYQNFISPSEKEIVRGILEIYAQKTGVEFREIALDGADPAPGGTLIIGKGDLQAADPETTSGPGGIAGLGGGNLVVLDKEDFQSSDRFFGDGFTGVMFHEVGHALGLGHSYDIPAVQGDGTGTDVQPGDHDLIHLNRISPPNANDIDLYRFNLTNPGTVQIETIAERLTQAENSKDPSLLNTVLRLFRKNADGTSELIAQNDRYYGSDSFIEVELDAGEYFFGVSSAGNDQYDPAIANSGFGGTTDGQYEVQLSFTATPSPVEQITDMDGTLIDGDGDGAAGGVHSFWFESIGTSNTFFVDKLAASGGNGAIATPFNTIAPALAAAGAAGGRSLVRIVGNVDPDDPNGLANAQPYLIGFRPNGTPLPDGNSLEVPKDTTVRMEAGTLIKMRAANIDVGSSSIGADRSKGAIQVLGTPEIPVYLRSYHDDDAGGNSDGNGPLPAGGDYGGIVMRDDSDLEPSGVFLNAINHADIRHGGGRGNPTANKVFSPIDVMDARPTVSFNTITDAAKAAVAATPNSFDDSGGRIGPDILGNYLRGNTDNGLVVGISTPLGGSVEKMTVSGRFDDTDITHIVTESLIIAGNPGGPVDIAGVRTARPSGRLVIDPGTVVKLREARIESERGAATLIAEGTADNPIIFTSLEDSRYGGSGVFDTNSGPGTAAAGDWGGLFFGETSSGSIDHAVISYGGGVVPTGSTGGGASDRFNAVEIHQADVRIANSLISDNENGNANGNRFGRGFNQSAAIYVRGSQPILIGNEIVDNEGSAIYINANSLQYETLVDPGRSIGAANRHSEFDDNRGPLIRLNEIAGNDTNGLRIKGETLTIESIWDDSDIVHVLDGVVTVGNHHTYSGLRLQSNVSESLVVKVDGNNSGFTATGTPLDIVDRIGGTIQVIGLPGYPVVLTHLNDDTVGAGFTPDGRVNVDTNGGGGNPGTWRGFLFDEWSNDRNVAIIREAEAPLTGNSDINSTPITKAQPLGTLAPDMKSGDENRRLGFEVHGYISPDNAKDVDVYSFEATAGTPVWIDVDRTQTSLDTVVELVLDDGTSTGQLINTFDNPLLPGDLNTLQQEPLLGGDFYSLSNNDPGAAITLSDTGTYYLRVKSAGTQVTKGEYQLQLRLQQVDEFPGSTVRYADVRYASTAFDVRGLPRHSPLIGDAGEVGDAGDNVTQASSQELINLLQSDTAAISVAGSLDDATDVDVYGFNVTHTAIQDIPGVTTASGTVAVTFDLDYADEARGDTSIAVFDAGGALIFLGRESNIADDQPETGPGTDGKSLDDLNRGSLGTDDPSIGPVHLLAGEQYYVAVMSNQMTPTVVASQFSRDGLNGTGNAGILTRLEPINSVTRVVEDHIGFTGYTTGNDELGKLQIDPLTGPLLEIDSSANLDKHITQLRLQDVPLFWATDSGGENNDNLYTVDAENGGPIITDLTPFNDNLTGGRNDIQDIVIRGDGHMYGYRRVENSGSRVGELVRLDPFDGSVLSTQSDNITGNPNVANIPTLTGTLTGTLDRDERANEITNSDEVDAVTFRRDGDNNNTQVPVPRYETFYSVRESDGASRLYRGNRDGNADTASRTNTTNRYGYMGHIQPAGVSFARTFYDIDNNKGGADRETTRILLRSNIPGAAGNFTVITTTGHNQSTAVTSVNTATNTIRLRLSRGGDPSVVTATAQNIVDAINNDDDANDLVTAILYSGNTSNGNARTGLVALGHPTTTNGTGGADGPDGPLQGRVTGLSMAQFDGGGELYGVTSGGELISINQNNGEATVLKTLPGVSFSGLALGPQNVEEGIYRNVLFASTSGGEVYTFDVASSQVVSIVNPGTPSDAGAFKLTFDDDEGNPNSRQTTVPIDAGAPTKFSVNEQQKLQTDATTGAFTLSVERARHAVSSLQTASTAVDGTIAVQNVPLLDGISNFPATPFVVQVENEQMLVTNRAGNTFTVTRGHNGTIPAAHPDTATVREVITSTLATGISASTPMITVADATPLPSATPFQIRVGDEDMRVHAVAGNNLVVTRGINGTPAVGAPAGASVVAIESTDPLAFFASAGQIQTALADLNYVGAGNVTARGRISDGVTVEFRNQLGSLDIAPLRVGSLPPLPPGAPPVDLDLDSPVNVTEEIDGKLSVREALVVLSNINVADISLSGALDDTGVTIHFTGAFIASDQVLLDVDNSLMLNGTSAGATVAKNAFDDSHVNITGDSGTPIGLAFSPLDFNLWHPTTLRANDVGHGVNNTPDNSRYPGTNDIDIPDGITGHRDTTEGSGGASFYFGLEQWIYNPQDYSRMYMSPPDRGTNAQYGLSGMQHRDLSSNTAIRETYDFAGGAKGSLTTNPFSLEPPAGANSLDYYDRPTLYFNYLLETEAADGRNIADINADRFFADSARVYASRDGGVTWELLATNNSQWSDPDASDGNRQAELPTFLSHVADAGANSGDPQPETKQIRQELFDSAANNLLWHQARIDLSPFVGEGDVRLRFDFSTSGSSIDGNLPGDEFGDIGDTNDSVGGDDNNHHGFFIDDILVGYAERGEMVTAAPDTQNNAFVNLRTAMGGRANVQRDEDAASNDLSGDYQLEIRRTGEYAAGVEGSIIVLQNYDTNVRHILDSLVGTGLDADRNEHRPQGILVLESNIISDSRTVGINVQPGASDGDGNGVTTPGATQNFVNKDNDQFIPGVVIQNNIIASSSGIDYSGEGTTDNQRPVPIGRIINNTFIGDGGGTFGVNINNNASPTLLNNLFTETGNGIINNGRAAVIDNNFFQDAGGGARGTDPRFGTGQLFVDQAAGNYYPAPTAGTINNSQANLNDRGSYAAFKDILGIPDSPFFAPTLDVLGQLRVSGGVGGGGAGSNNDIDIGAMDYSDFRQPYASLLNPVDNDIEGLDSDAADTFIQLNDPVVEAFSILLSDGENANSPFEGTGINPATVNESTVLIRQDNRMLKADVDFRLAFNASTGELRLTPLSTLWNPNSVYEIVLVNGDHQAVTFDVANGSVVGDGDQITVGDGSGDDVVFEFDSGYVLQLGAPNTISDGQTFEYTTPTGTEGYTARFQIEKLTGTPTGNFVDEVLFDDNLNDDNLILEVADPDVFSEGDFIRLNDEIMVVVQVDVNEGVAAGTPDPDKTIASTIRVHRAVMGTQEGAHRSRVEVAASSDSTSLSSAMPDVHTGGSAVETEITVNSVGDLNLLPSGITSGAPTTDYLDANPSYVQIEQEILRVRDIDGPNLTVERAALGTPRSAHPSTATVTRVVATFANDIEVLDQGARASAQSSIGGTAADTNLTVFQGADLGLDTSELAQSGSRVFVRVNDEIMRVTGYNAGTDTLTVVRGALGTTIEAHQQYSVVEVIATDRAATLAPTQSVNVDDVLLDGTSPGPLTISGSTFLKSDHVIDVVPGPDFQPKVGDLLQIGTEITRIHAIDGNSLTLERGLYDTEIVEHSATVTETIGGVETTYPLPIRLIDSAFEKIVLFESDPLDDVEVSPGNVQSGIATKIATAMRNFRAPAPGAEGDLDLRLPHAQAIENGQVYLGGHVGDIITMNSSTSDGLAATVVAGSQPGVSAGAVAVPFIPSVDFPQTALNAAVISAINNSDDLDLHASSEGGNGFYLIGENGVAIGNISVTSNAGGFTTNTTNVTGIKDLAENPLRPNRETETRFTIGIGANQQYDYGDAVDTFDTENRARHSLLSRAEDLSSDARLGSLIDPTGRVADAETITPSVVFDLANALRDDGKPVTASLAVATNDSISTIEIPAGAGNAFVPFTLSYLLIGDEEVRLMAVSIGTGSGSNDVLTVQRSAAGASGGGESHAAGTEIVTTPLSSKLTGEVDLESTQIEVTPSTGSFFNDRIGGYLLLGEEIVLLQAINGDVLTVARGQLDTIPTGHGPSEKVSVTDDENGIDLSSVHATFNYARTQANGGGPVQVIVNATDYGVVDGWIDFNSNGLLDEGAGIDKFDERVFNSVAVWPGENQLSVNIPTLPDGSVPTGDMAMRLRISTLGGLAADGLAIGGEVEDHRITVVAGAPPMLLNLNALNTPDDQDESFTYTENVLGTPFVPPTPQPQVFGPSVDVDGDSISVLEIVDLRTGRAYPIDPSSGEAVIPELHDSLGRIAGHLSVNADSTVTFVPRTNYDTGAVAGPDGIPGNADDVTPTITFGYRLVDDSNVAGVETGTVTLTVEPVNQAPTLDAIATASDDGIDLATLVEDQDLDNDDTIDTHSVTLTGISAGGDDVQPVQVTVSTENLAFDGTGFVAADSQSPTLITGLQVVGLDDNPYDGGSSNAKLNFTTTPDQYGTAVIRVTVSDTPGADGILGTDDDFYGPDGAVGGGDDIVPVVRTLTVTVAPVNDKPDTVERVWTQDEAVEGIDPAIAFAFTAADLTGTSGVANPFDDKTQVDAGGSGAAPFNEANQLGTLAVHKLVFGADAVIEYDQTDTGGNVTHVVQPARTLDFRNLDNSTGSLFYSDVTVTFSGSDGPTGTLVIEHSGGRFDSGVYTPEVDVNNNYDGVPQELQYVVSDSGVSTAPKVLATDPDVQLPDANPTAADGQSAPIDSDPEIIRFSITPGADAPFLGDFKTDINFDETEDDTDPSNDSYVLQLADLFDDPSQGFLLGSGADATGTVPASWITIVPNVNNPAGLLPEPTVHQADPNAPISLTFTPVPDAYGVAEFAITVENPNNSLSVTKTLTVTVNPTNDAPVTFDRLVTGDEDIVHTFTRADLLGSGVEAAQPSKFVNDGVTNSLYDESEQTLEVYGFFDPRTNTEYLSSNYNSGAGVNVEQSVDLPNGTLVLNFVDGAFVSGDFTPDPDYFVADAAGAFTAGDYLQYGIYDTGNDNLNGPDGAGGTDVVGTVLVANPLTPGGPITFDAANLTFFTQAVNDTPTIPPFGSAPGYSDQTVTFYEDQPLSFNGTLSANLFAPGTRILPGPPSEQLTQSIDSITLNQISGPAMFVSGSSATLTTNGQFAIQPLPDANGTAVFEITITDSEGATISPKPQVTVNITPVNDQPVAFDRSIVIDEAIEPAVHPGEVITAADLINGAPGSSEMAAIPARADIDPTFNESAQTLEVVQVIVPDSNGNPRVFRGAPGEPTEILTVNGARVSLVFGPSSQAAGLSRFVSATYVPAIDYNQTTPYFNITDDFSYVVRDSGPNAANPGAIPPHDNLSDPATVRISVIAKNDLPLFPPLEITDNTITFTEVKTGDTTPQLQDVYTDSTTQVRPGSLSARDETALQTASVHFVPVSVPGGLMEAGTGAGTAGGMKLPTMTNDGVIRVFPATDAFGDAVYNVIVSDRNRDGWLSDTAPQQVTISITGTNDAPVALDQTPITTAENTSVTIHDASGAAAADLSASAKESSLPGTSPFNEQDQDLQVIGIGIVTGNPPVNAPTPSVLATSPAISYAFDSAVGTRVATQRFRTTHGTLDISFEERVNGDRATGFISKIDYTPDENYNNTQGQDVFTYFVSDYGSMEVPGSTPTRTLDIPDDVTSKISEPARITMNVTPVNDPPVIPEFENSGVFTFAEDAVAPATVRTQVFLDDNLVINAGQGADEAAQTVRITVSTADGALANDLFDSPPTLTANGTLEIFPNANVFGTIDYTVSVVDVSSAGTVLTSPPVTRDFTIQIDSVNDQPVASAKGFILMEHREQLDTNGDPVPTSNGIGYLDIGASDLLAANAAGGGAAANSFADSGIGAPYDESDQIAGLRVTALGLPGSTTPSKSADDAALIYALDAGRITATDSLDTANGTLTITFEQNPSDTADKFIASIRYTPDVDYSSATPFDPSDQFTYFVDDHGDVNHQSEAATVTMSVTPTNDLPFIPTLLGGGEFTFAEDSGPYSTNVFANPGDEILPGPAGALDELQFSRAKTELTRSSGTPGMFAVDPTLSNEGLLTFESNPDAFGSAVFDVLVSETDLSGNTTPTLNQTRTIQVTLTLTPENNVPTAPNRVLEMDEFSELENGTGDPVAGPPTMISVAASRLLDLSGVHEGPARASESTTFPETQDLRVSGIGLSGGTTPIVSADALTYTLNTDTGKKEASQTLNLPNGELTVTFVEVGTGATAERFFDRLEYNPDPDFNTSTPGTTPDRFTYFVTDSGTPEETSVPGVVTLQVNPTNDVPTFTLNTGTFGPGEVLYSLERDDERSTSFPDILSDIAPGPATAIDEQADQTVLFRYQSPTATGTLGNVSTGTGGTVLSDLFHREPELINGTLFIYPAKDAFGTADLVFRAEDGPDSRLPAGADTKWQELTLKIRIGEVNDAPVLDTSFAPKALTANKLTNPPTDPADVPDDVFQVEADGTIVYTLREDASNIINEDLIDGSGDTLVLPDGKFLIQVPAGVQDPENARASLLDPYLVGPANELAVQQFSDVDIPTSTTLGGTLETMSVGGEVTWLLYTPPENVNKLTNVTDFFVYTAIDDGQTFNLGSHSLDSDPKSVTGKVRLVLNPVNDAPSFTIDPARVDANGDAKVTVAEGATPGISFNLISEKAAGPDTATDETDVNNGQSISFTVTPDPTNPAGAFTAGPAIDAQGRLTFTAAPHVSGDFVFNVIAVDSGANDPARGDVSHSAAQQFTISIFGVNDPPQVKDGEDGVTARTTTEDNVRTAAGTGGLKISVASLLDEFQPGPTGTETGQTLSIASGLPTVVGDSVSTRQGGTITLESSGLLVYSPGKNFVGEDVIVYEVTDGETPVRTARGTLPITVAPINDAPDISSLDLTINVTEDTPPYDVIGWFAGAAVGPVGDASGAGRASDEIDGIGSTPAQQFGTITIRPDGPLADYEDLFEFTGAQDSIVQLVGNDLKFNIKSGASGTATFDVTVFDRATAAGPDLLSSTAKLTINIGATNDPPSFTVSGDNPISYTEGEGVHVANNWATDIQSGEGSGQTTRFVLDVAPGDQALFTQLPTIDSTAGQLTFALEDEANGSIVVDVYLTDDTDPDDGVNETSDGLPALNSATVQLTINIDPVNDPPTATDNNFISTEDSILTFSIQDLIDDDTDIDPGDSLTLVTTSGTNYNPTPTGAQVTTAEGALVSINTGSGLITYNPLGSPTIQGLQEGDSLEDTFEYTVMDSGGLTSTAMVTLTISGANDAPVANDDVISFFYETGSTGNPIAKSLMDPGNSIFTGRPDGSGADMDVDFGDDVDINSFTVTRNPQFGEVREIRNAATNALEGLEYLPGPDFLTQGNGQDTFEYTISDGAANPSGQPSAPATVRIVTRPTPGVEPIRSGTFNNPTTGNSGTAVVDLNDVFITTDGLDLSGTVIKINGTKGNAVIDANGQLVYTPHAGETGEDTVTIEVQDVNGVRGGDVEIQFNITKNPRTNPIAPSDVNHSGFVTALDALVIINQLNSRLGASGASIPISEIPADDDFFYDVNDDGRISAVDALQVINFLNANGSANPTGEPIAPQATSGGRSQTSVSPAAPVSSVGGDGAKVVGDSEREPEQDWLSLIASDQAEKPDSSDSDSPEDSLDVAISDLF